MATLTVAGTSATEKIVREAGCVGVQHENVAQLESATSVMVSISAVA